MKTEKLDEKRAVQLLVMIVAGTLGLFNQLELSALNFLIAFGLIAIYVFGIYFVITEFLKRIVWFMLSLVPPYAEMIRLYVEDNLSMVQIGKKLKRSSRTPQVHIDSHNAAVKRSGFCAACKRAQSVYVSQEIGRSAF